MGYYGYGFNFQRFSKSLYCVFILPYCKFGQRIILTLRYIEIHLAIQNEVYFDGCCMHVCFGDCFMFMCVYFVVDTVS